MIKAAAIKDPSGKVYSMPKPNRHDDIAKKMEEHNVQNKNKWEYGFVTSENEFVDRKKAGKIALKNKQTEGMKNPPNLHSHDLW